ncbi:translation initiation factor IF-3 [Dysgonomonas sp. GY617]|uniref:translation initiation factor IF-3 n=1 Tax=Dysgonomonas sp. GY617 TaxID=2780420 RepID=UPI0018EF44CA
MRNNRINNNKKEELHRINEKIRVPQVRLVGENIEQGVYSTHEALKIADEKGLDLVEISPSADPPVCRITDYQKFLYQQKKKLKEQKAKTVKVVVKEIRFGPQTDDHDFNFKLKHAKSFLEEGCKVKAYVFFKGRSILFKEQGEVLLLRFATELEDFAKVDQLPQLEGKKMIIMLSPKKVQPKPKPVEDKPHKVKEAKPKTEEKATTEPEGETQTQDTPAAE